MFPMKILAHKGLIFWCWRQNIPASGVNNMSADTLAPKDAIASADMVLAV